MKKGGILLFSTVALTGLIAAFEANAGELIHTPLCVGADIIKVPTDKGFTLAYNFANARSAYGSHVGDASYNPTFDLDNNGSVDNLDIYFNRSSDYAICVP